MWACLSEVLKSVGVKYTYTKSQSMPKKSPTLKKKIKKAENGTSQAL